MHAYTHTEEDPHLLCIVLPRRQKYLFVQTNKQLQEIED